MRSDEKSLFSLAGKSDIMIIANLCVLERRVCPWIRKK